MVVVFTDQSVGTVVTIFLILSHVLKNEVTFRIITFQNKASPLSRVTMNYAIYVSNRINWFCKILKTNHDQKMDFKAQDRIFSWIVGEYEARYEQDLCKRWYGFYISAYLERLIIALSLGRPGITNDGISMKIHRNYPCMVLF